MTKTEFMLIGSRQRLYALTNPLIPEINGAPITQVSVAKSLGVLIDNNLNWSSHVDKLTKKVASGIGALKRIRHLVPQTTLRSIYHALLQPHFDYCNVVWGNCGITLHDKLQKLQNKAARVLTFSNFDANASELFKILGWKNLVSQQQIALATMVNLVPRSHSVTGNVRSGKVRQYTIFHWPLKKGCGNAIYVPIGLFRGVLNEGLVFASSCAVLNKCQLCGGKFCFFRRWKSFTVEENHFKKFATFV